MATSLPQSSTHAQASASDAFARIERDPFPKTVALYPQLRLVGRLTVDDYMALMPDETPELYAVSILAINQPANLTSICHFLDLLSIEHGHGGLGRGSLWPLAIVEIRKALDHLASKGHLNRRQCGSFTDYESLTLEDSVKREPVTVPAQVCVVESDYRQILIHGIAFIGQTPDGLWFLGRILREKGHMIAESLWSWSACNVQWLPCDPETDDFSSFQSAYRDLLIAAHELLRNVPGERPAVARGR